MALAQRNVNLVIADIDAAATKETAVACRQSGVVVHCLQTDLANAEGPSDMINQTLAVCERLDILVNNAAYAIAEPFLDMTATEWDRVYALNIRAVALATSAGGRVMCQQGGGRIINVTNLGGRTPGPASMPTSISRAAGIAITKGLSKDLAKENILVTTVCIGLIKSGQHQPRYDARLEKEPNLSLETFYDELAAGRNVPIGRVGVPEEAGDVIAFLASERAS